MGVERGLFARGLRACALFAVLISGVAAQGVPQGLVDPVTLPPFDEAAPACTAPTGLQRIIGFARDNSRDFIDGAGAGLAAAARDRGLGYEAVVADNDAAKQMAQVQDFIDRRIGAIVAPPVDPASLAPLLQAQIAAGGYVGTVVPPPAVTILNAPQYMTGWALGALAADYIRDRLGRRAKVALLTQDSMQFLAPRFVAIRDALGALPGVDIVADISPNPVNSEGGYRTMQLILQAHPDIDVVLGADAVVMGALKALREAGKDRPEQFLGGIDGEREAIAELRTPQSPFKASIALSSPIFGYALGIAAADWLEGKSVPQGMDALPIGLTAENLAAYEADQADPGAVYADPARRDIYITRYGNICFDTRDIYLNFPWSSEG